MSARSGRRLREPFAYYDPDSSCWRTSQGSFLLESLPESPVTFPTSGTWGRGGACEQQMSEPRTAASGASSLLPTPVVNDMGRGKTVEWWDSWTAGLRAKHGNGNGHVERARPEPGGGAAAARWGKYAAAVERWERVSGRAAPPPADLPAVTEWLMGLPAGWVTAVPGLSVPHQLKALGNGVVPQQAAAAYASLLPRIGWAGVQ